jgi:dienelactone hydrolase
MAAPGYHRELAMNRHILPSTRLHTIRALPAIGMLVATMTSTATLAQNGGPPAMPSPEFIAQMRAEQERFNAMPDTPGTGRFTPMKEAVASLPGHVIYRPADLSKVGAHALGIVVWGNGGCSSDAAGGRLHLLQIASHGYIAIAPGALKSGPGAPPQPPMPMPKPGAPMGLPPAETTAEQVAAGIDWAIAQNSQSGSPYFGKIDTRAVAASGWSCGGIQALKVATSDPRIRAVVIHNSGIFNGPSAMKAMDIGKAALDRLHSPILYILGGPRDIAYANGMDDYARITKVPAVVASLDKGHGGTFAEPDGGAAALAAVAWLDWQLKGDAKAAHWFTGADCGLCTDKAWTIQRKGID